MQNNNMMIGLVAVVLVLVVGAFLLMRNQSTPTMMDTTETESMTEPTTNPAADDTNSMVDATSTEVTLSEVADSATKQAGTATLTEKDGKVEVVVTVSPTMKAAQPAHIHMGECPGVGEIAYPLTSLTNGTSTTMLDVTMADLLAQKPLAINVHKSADEVKVYTACGSL
jgi:hypothetical protein